MNINLNIESHCAFTGALRGVVTHSPSTSEVSGSNPRTLCEKVGSCLPMVGSLHWKVGSLLTDGQQFTVRNLDQAYLLVSSAHKTTRRDMTCTVLKKRRKTPNK